MTPRQAGLTPRHYPCWPPLAAGVLGAIFFGWLAGPRVLDPTEVGWVMKGDWQWHFMGWHLFRSQAWTWPPGAITGYLEPIGSALGYTDSIPLAAFLLKPVAWLLPNPFQYLGLWFFLCFTLQGFFGALVVGTWTSRPSLQITGGALLVLMPTLLARMAHPALSSHWLLLWALWLNWRDRPSAPASAPERLTTITHSPNRYDTGQHATLGLVSGLVHPYLAVMVLLLLAAVALRRAMFAEDRVRSRFSGFLPLATAVAAVVAGWWMSGLFTLTSTADLQYGGLGDYSMNLLGPLTPAGRSLFLPDMPIVTIEQIGEGFHYFGAGALCLCAVALGLGIRHWRRWSRASLPLLVVIAGCVAFALSPRVTFGDRVLIDLVAQVGSVSMFRASARFFWPVTYAVVTASIGVVAVSLKPRFAAVVIAAALALQLADLHKWFLSVHDGARGEVFFVWDTPLRSPEWHTLLPAYDHIRMYSPEFCRGPIPVPPVHAAYLAGIHGLGINDGPAARVDTAREMRECARLREDFSKGVLDDSTVYLVAPSLVAEFEQHAGGAAACRQIDGVPVCVTSRSLARGRP